MRRTYIGLFLLALTTLVVEVLLTRIFDVLLWPNFSFMIISGAIFGLGLGGLYELLWPPRPGADGATRLAPAALAFGVTIWALPLLLNAIPFALASIANAPIAQMGWFLLLYVVLLMPFVFVGVCVCGIFSRDPGVVHRLYFWDLSGAALGTALLIPLLPPLGPERLLVGASLIALLASALLAQGTRWRAGVIGLAVVLVATPSWLGTRYAPLKLHDNKRDTESSIEAGRLEFSRWDPVSQIAVIDHPAETHTAGDHGWKHIAYDGGSQSSDFFPFDGNLAALRRDLRHQLLHQFWQRSVLAAHYLRRDTGYSALIIGSAGGQETKAALMYGAGHIDAVEMVRTVVALGKGRYAGYIGHLFDRPSVHVHVGEGRSFLRASHTQYDVIQIFSNYTTSSIASGSGAISAAYLQTREADIEYFTHLRPNGIVQINHIAYPRTIATAAAAWRALGRTDFRCHVVVVEKQPPIADYLPTVLIKNAPWSAAEVADLDAFFSMPVDGEAPYRIVENPFDATDSFLPAAFFEGELPPALLAAAPYRVSVVTDDRPFFHFLRRWPRRLRADRPTGLNLSTADVINAQLRDGWIPLDWLHLIVGSIASLFYGALFVIVPLWASRVGRQPWVGKAPVLAYFSLLGFGFIAIELLLIQILMKLIGYPLYTVTTVIAVMLVGAAAGSLTAPRVVGTTHRRWLVPFIGIVATGAALWLGFAPLADHFIVDAIGMRIVVASLIVLPLAFWMGMPFPLGLAAIADKPSGAIAWAWSMNGLCTAIGAVLTAVLSLALGFRGTLVVALFAYACAGAMFALMKRGSSISFRTAPTMPGAAARAAR